MAKFLVSTIGCGVVVVVGVVVGVVVMYVVLWWWCVALDSAHPSNIMFELTFFLLDGMPLR